MSKRVVVCGAGGFIGFHLTKALKEAGCWVRGADLKSPEFAPTSADEFAHVDLRDPTACRDVVQSSEGPVDAVYQLAADMGGMGFIHSHECEIMTNSCLINTNMARAAAEAGVGSYFFSSSACVYRDQPIGDQTLAEADAYPAQPDNEYGWEKLYAERVALAYGRNLGMDVRIARFQNCYGPYGTWQGGREKAPAAICRKAAMADDGGEIEVWGDGTAQRTYVYVEDLCRAILMLMNSSVREPTNIGNDEQISVNELVETVIRTSGKTLSAQHIDGPVGVRARYHATEQIRSTGWEPRVSFAEGIERTYAWIADQVTEDAEPESSGVLV